MGSKHRLSALNPYYNGDFEQREAGLQTGARTRAMERNQKQSLIRDAKGRIIIPEASVERVIVHNHLVCKHSSLEKELAALEGFAFNFKGGIKLKQVIRQLRQKCLCSNRRPGLIRRPLELTKMATKPGEVIHSDWLQLNDGGHVIVLRGNSHATTTTTTT